jgi:hypothetical protein
MWQPSLKEDFSKASYAVLLLTIAAGWMALTLWRNCWYDGNDNAPHAWCLACPCREKFEELKAKEKELNTFLDAFPQRKAAKAAELAAKQEAVVAGLERMSKLQALTDAAALPSQGQFQQMKVGARGDIFVQALQCHVPAAARVHSLYVESCAAAWLCSCKPPAWPLLQRNLAHAGGPS